MNKPLTLSIAIALSLPAISPAQNLYLSGGSGGDIYRYTMDGTRTTIATGLQYSGLACDSAGNLFAASPAPGGNSIYKFTPAGVRTTFASGLHEPQGLTFDNAGMLFVADFAGSNIYQFTPGGLRTTFASHISPQGLGFDTAGNLFVSTYRGGSLLKFAPGGGQTTFGSGLLDPWDVACDASGNVFVADWGGGLSTDGFISKFSPDGTRTIFDSGFDSTGLAFDPAGNLFATDFNNDRIYKYAPNGTRTIFASGVVGHGAAWLAFAVPEPPSSSLLAIAGLTLFAFRNPPRSPRRLVPP